MTDYKSIKYNISGADLTGLTASQIPNLDTSKITTGTMADARISSSSVVQHSPETDLQPVKSDISALALREATNESSAAFNLPNQFIDTFATDVLGTKTDVGISSGYVSSISGQALPTGTVFYMKGDNANGNTTFTDSSASPITTGANGGVTHSDNQGKIGSTSIFFDGTGDYLSGTNQAAFDFGTGEFLIETYVLFPHASAPNTHATIWSQGGFGASADYAGTSLYIATNGKINFHTSSNQTGAFGSWTVHVASNVLTWTEDQWYHISVERDADGIITMWRDGTELTYAGDTGKTGNTNLAEGDRSFKVGIASDNSNNAACEMFIDNFLIAKGTGAARGASYTPATAHYGLVTSATGTAIQAANAVGSAKTKVGGTMLMKDNAGTATLGTDLKIYFTCNGGTGTNSNDTGGGGGAGTNFNHGSLASSTDSQKSTHANSTGHANYDAAYGGGGEGGRIVIVSGTASATGTLIQSANTVASAKTKVGGTMLYKDNAGTATLGTDLKIYFTCDNSNWTEAASYNAITPVYSTGIKQVRLGETTCTSGTDVRYKAVWANQAASSKETQLHGIGVNY